MVIVLDRNNGHFDDDSHGNDDLCQCLTFIVEQIAICSKLATGDEWFDFLCLVDNDDDDGDDDDDQAMNQSPGCCHCWTETVHNWELSTKGFSS